MSLPRPINWLREESTTEIEILRGRIRQLELQNFEMRNRIETAKEGITNLESGITEGVEEITASFQEQIQAYRDLLASLGQTLGALAETGQLIPSSVLQLFVERLEQFEQ